MSDVEQGEVSWLDILTYSYLEGVANGASRDKAIEKAWHITPEQVEYAKNNYKETQDEPPPVS